MLKKIASESKIKRMVSGRFSLKRAVLSTIGSEDFPIDKNSVAKVASKTLKSYKSRIKASDEDELSEEIRKNPKQLIQRVQNEVIYQVHDSIKDRYKGKRARWLPSDADEPRPEHQLNYGKIYIIGEGINGVEPGDEYGCKCGVEILTDETKLDI